MVRVQIGMNFLAMTTVNIKMVHRKKKKVVEIARNSFAGEGI